MSDAVETRSPMRRMLARAGMLLSTALTGALAVGLVVGGSGVIANRAESVELPKPAPLVAVQVERLERVAGYSVPRSFIGQIEAAQKTDLAFETGGTLAAVLVEEGDTVTAGQLLARVDTRALDAERAALEASRNALEARLELAELTTARQEMLEERGFAATQRLDEARLGAAELRARIAETDAAMAGLDVALDKAVLRAPFDGRVGARQADTGQTLGAGTPVLSLLEAAAPQMRVGLPPALAATLTPGDTVVARFGDTAYPAHLTQLRPDLDPVTRTRSAVFTLDPAPGQAMPAYGASGRIEMTEAVADPGAWVPLLALHEGAGGSWTVLTVTDGVVAPEAVELLYADADRAFVRGAFPDGVELVAAGPHRLAPGQTVRAE